MPKLQWLDINCHSCGRQLNSWDERLSKALAYKKTVCESCIAKEYDISSDELRDKMEDYFGMRPCQGI
jgi:NMD protein affecting ribosome stability and mRNA decay